MTPESNAKALDDLASQICKAVEDCNHHIARNLLTAFAQSRMSEERAQLQTVILELEAKLEKVKKKSYANGLKQGWFDKAMDLKTANEEIDRLRKELEEVRIKYAECKGCGGTKKGCDWAVRYHNAIACCPDCDHGNAKAALLEVSDGQ